jgi:hypothetical protein
MWAGVLREECTMKTKRITSKGEYGNKEEEMRAREEGIRDCGKLWHNHR